VFQAETRRVDQRSWTVHRTRETAAASTPTPADFNDVRQNSSIGYITFLISTTIYLSIIIVIMGQSHAALSRMSYLYFLPTMFCSWSRGLIVELRPRTPNTSSRFPSRPPLHPFSSSPFLAVPISHSSHIMSTLPFPLSSYYLFPHFSFFSFSFITSRVEAFLDSIFYPHYFFLFSN